MSAATKDSQAALTAKQAELAAVTQQIEQNQAKLAKPPTVASTVDTSEQRSQLANLKQQRDETVATIKDYQDKLAALGALSSSADQVTNISAQIKAIQDAGAGSIDAAQQQNDKINELTAQREEALQNFQAAVADLSSQGVQVPGGDDLDSQLKGVNDQVETNKSSLDAYKGQLDAIDAGIAKTNAAIQSLSAPKVDTSAVAKLQQDSATLLKQRADLQTTINDLQSKINQQTAVASIPRQNAGAQDAVAEAATNKQVADAKLNLLNAEKAYLITHQQLIAATATGNIDMQVQADNNEKAAKQALALALAQSKNILTAEQFAKATEGVAAAFAQVDNAAQTSGTQTKGIENAWQQSLDLLQGKVAKNPLVVPVVLAPANDSSAPTGGSTSTPKGNTGNGAEEAAQKSLQEAQRHSSEATNEHEQAVVKLTAAQNAEATATQIVANAQNALAAAHAAGNSASEAAAAAELKTAQNSLLAAQAETTNANFIAIVSGKKVELAQATVAETQALHGSAAAYEDNAGAARDNASAMQGTVTVAGQTVDAVSGLPVAFNSAELSAKQLGAELVTLEAQLQDIQAAASNAAFGISQQLIPSLGIAGSLQQGSQWAQQAEQVKQAFDAQNQMREAQGEDPLGAQVLDASMSALKANWSAYAQDATASMDTVEKKVDQHAKKMEAAAKQVDQALDGMVRSTLKPTSGGLIEGSIKDPKELEQLLPREDEVDEKARRMADVAVKGFKSPWFAGLKDLFPDDVLKGGEQEIRKAAAGMVRAHEEGLSTILYDSDAAVNKVLQQLEAKQNTDAFVAKIREKIKAMGKDVKDLDIQKALGIEITADDPEPAAPRARPSAQSKTLGFDAILAQIKTLGEGESPIVGLIEPKAEGKEKIKKAGTDSATAAGDALVSQISAGKYADKSITAITNSFKAKETEVRQSGAQVGDWLGGGLLTKFSNDVPRGLLDILVVKLVPLMNAAQAKDSERTSTTGSTAQ